MKKIATLSVFAFALATAGAFAQAPAAPNPPTTDKTTTKAPKAPKTAKTTKMHHKKGAKKGSTMPDMTPAQK